jgi:hypothetical protein
LQFFIVEEEEGIHEQFLKDKFGDGHKVQKKLWYMKQMTYLIGNYDLISKLYLPNLLKESLNVFIDGKKGSNISYTRVLNLLEKFYKEIGNYVEEKLKERGISEGFDDPRY